MSEARFKVWFPEDGETIEDAEDFETSRFYKDEHEEVAEEFADRAYRDGGGEIPSDGWTIAVLGEGETEPKVFEVSIDWEPTFHAMEKQG